MTLHSRIRGIRAEREKQKLPSSLRPLERGCAHSHCRGVWTSNGEDFSRGWGGVRRSPLCACSDFPFVHLAPSNNDYASCCGFSRVLGGAGSRTQGRGSHPATTLYAQGMARQLLQGNSAAGQVPETEAIF